MFLRVLVIGITSFENRFHLPSPGCLYTLCQEMKLGYWLLSFFPIKQPESAIERVDLYLTKWDEWAKSGDDPRYHLGRNYHYFEDGLLRLFRSRDPRAISRFIFYQLVQVGGFIEVDSPLGSAFNSEISVPCPFAELDEGPLKYFAGDLYFWWLKQKGSYPSMPLMERWIQSDFAKRTAIPMYEGARGNA